MNKADIVGRWHIVQWVQSYDDGRLTYPMGENLRGFLEYGSSGSLMVLIEKAVRTPFTSGGQWSASDAEKAQAYDGFMCYAGTFEVRGSQLVHNIEHSIFPNWEGAQQKRNASLSAGGEMLTLSGRIEEGTAQARTIKLIWKRSSP